jgi:hypothetical protein
MSIHPDPLIIGGIALPDLAQFNMRNQRSPLGSGSSVLRFSDGTSIKQTAWQKRTVDISADGWIPAGLDAIDWTQPVTISGGGRPDITIWSAGPTEILDAAGAVWGWSLTGEEV